MPDSLRRATRRAVLICAAVSLLAGSVVGGVMAFIDWRLNPGGVFRDNDGTRWLVVVETAWTWAWPVALLFAALVLPIALLRSGRRRKR